MCEEQHLVRAGNKGRLAEMMATMCNPASMVNLELVYSSIYACCGDWYHARLGWDVHVTGKSQYGAWVLVHNRHGYRTEQLLCCGDVDPVKKLGVTL